VALRFLSLTFYFSVLFFFPTNKPRVSVSSPFLLPPLLLLGFGSVEIIVSKLTAEII